VPEEFWTGTAWGTVGITIGGPCGLRRDCPGADTICRMLPNADT